MIHDDHDDTFEVQSYNGSSLTRGSCTEEALESIYNKLCFARRSVKNGNECLSPSMRLISEIVVVP